MHTAGKIFVKTYLKVIRDFFPTCETSQYVIFLSSRMGKFKLLDLQGDPPPPQFPRLMGYRDALMRKILRVVDLLTVMIYEKEETIFYFLMVFNLLKIIHPFESKKYLRT